MLLFILFFLLTSCIGIIIYLCVEKYANNDDLSVTKVYTKSKVYKASTFPLTFQIGRGARLPFDIFAIQNAARTLNQQLNFIFFETTVLTSDSEQIKKPPLSKIVNVQIVENNHNKNHQAFDGPGNILAHATLPPYKDLCIDSSEQWTYDKLYFTLLHEMGHLLGLFHSKDKKSIMYSTYIRGNNFIQSDLENLKIMYPDVY
jgi:predicted Zn-dependent protease